MSDKNNQVIYWDALQRILEGKPIVVKRGDPISFDLVAIEAGRGRGSLKACRRQYDKLRRAIQEAADLQITPVARNVSHRQSQDKSKEKNQEIANLKNERDAARGRELMLILYIDKLEKEVLELRRPRVVNIRGD